MRTLTLTLLICLVALAAVASAQDKPPAAAAPPDKPAAVASPPDNPFSAFNKQAYAFVKNAVLRSAEKMPEENYSFKPTEAVRSFGQVLGHVADGQYLFCSKARGEDNPTPKIEQTKTSKADLIAALKDAFAYCDKAYDTMTDAAAAQTVKLFASDLPKPAALTANNMHTVEHYGNLITYLRLKNIVPPTSEPRPQPEPKK